MAEAEAKASTDAIEEVLNEFVGIRLESGISGTPEMEREHELRVDKLVEMEKEIRSSVPKDVFDRYEEAFGLVNGIGIEMAYRQGLKDGAALLMFLTGKQVFGKEV